MAVINPPERLAHEVAKLGLNLVEAGRNNGQQKVIDCSILRYLDLRRTWLLIYIWCRLWITKLTFAPMKLRRFDIAAQVTFGTELKDTTQKEDHFHLVCL